MTHDHLKHDTLKQIEARMDDARHAASINVLVDDLDALVKRAHDYNAQGETIRALVADVERGKEASEALTKDNFEKSQEVAKLVTAADALQEDVAGLASENGELQRANDAAVVTIGTRERRIAELETQYADTFALNQTQASKIDALQTQVESFGLLEAENARLTAVNADQAAEIVRLGNGGISPPPPADDPNLPPLGTDAQRTGTGDNPNTPNVNENAVDPPETERAGGDNPQPNSLATPRKRGR